MPHTGLAFAALGLLLVSQAQPRSPLDRPTTASYAAPLWPADVPDLLPKVLTRARVVYGVEAEPGKPSVAVRRKLEEVTGTVKTVLDALDLARLDYRWELSGEVIVVRPLSALTNPDHLLNRRLAIFSLEKVDAAAALDAFTDALKVDAAIAQGHSDRRRFSVSRRGATAFEVLNAIVAAHGGIGWELRVSRTGETGRLAFKTFDGKGVGTVWPRSVLTRRRPRLP